MKGRVSYPKILTEEAIIERLSEKIGEEVLNYNIISDTRKREPYKVKNGSYALYLDYATKIVDDTCGFIRKYLPIFSSKRGAFDYVRRRGTDFLSKDEILAEFGVKTQKGEKLVDDTLDIPSSATIILPLYKIKGQYIYVFNHLKSRVSLVIGDPVHPQSENHILEDSMEEFWHIAITPYLVDKVNKTARSDILVGDARRKILIEGEELSRLFTFASFDEFKKKKGYGDAELEREIKTDEKILVEQIERRGIKNALKDITKGFG